MTMTLLTFVSAAVIAEAVLLVGVLTLALRLRARLARVSGLHTAALAQMSELVQEAEALSAELAERLAEQMRLSDALEARLHAAAVADPAPPMATTRRKATRPPATRPEAGETATATGKATAARSRARAASASPEAAPRAGEAARDIEAARENGMDPLGIAIQRSLAGKRSALA